MQSRAKVLVVEDELIIAQNIARYLAHLGYDVTGLCSSSEDVVQALGETVPDVVLMDIRIEGPEDGVSLAVRLRREWHIPVVFLSALMDDDTLARAKITEPFGYIVKPFTQRELHVALEMALYKAALERRLADQEVLMQALIESMKQGFCLLDEAGAIVYANKEMVRILGKEGPAACIGLDLDTQLWPPGLLRDRMAENEPEPFDVGLIDAQGRTHHHIVTLQAVPGSKGARRGTFISFTEKGP